MKGSFLGAALAVLAVMPPAAALVGGATPAADAIGRSVVTIVGSRGNFCSGSLIAPELVLTAAHCVQPGAEFTIAGVGVTVRGDGKSAGVTRAASLLATGRPGTLQIRLVDPATEGARDGLSACTGDSGGPVFEKQPAGAVIVGVISWSTGPNNGAGCGGLTGVTPLTLYRDWILRTARQWGFAL